MISAVGAPLRSQLRRAAEFAHRNDERLIEQTALTQVLDESCDEMIEQRQERSESFANAAVRRNIVAMRVPSAGRGVITQVERDERDSRFDQASRSSTCWHQR